MNKPQIDLGLGDLSDFQPEPARPRMTPDERRAVDSVGREHGFSRPAHPEPMKVSRARTTGEPMDQLSMRGPLSVINRFKIYCTDKGKPSYWAAIDEWMRAEGY